MRSLAVRLLMGLTQDTYMRRFAWTRRISKEAFISKRADVIGWGNVKLGPRSYIDDYVLLDAADGRIEIEELGQVYRASILSSRGGTIKVGRKSTINDRCVLLGHGDLTIGENVNIAPQCGFSPMNHGFPYLGINASEKGIMIEDDVWIGMGAKILDGVTIGRGSVVGAGAVVKEDVARYSLAVGVPAREIRRASEADYQALRNLIV